MRADGVQPHARRAAVVGLHEQRARAEHVLQHREAVLEVALELHPHLRKRASCDDRDALEDPRGHEAARDDQRGDRGGAEVLDVRARGVAAARRRRHRLGEVAPAALVAVPDRLLAGAEDVVDRVGVDAVVGEQAQQRQGRARLPREVLQEHVRAQGGIALVGATHGSGQAIGAQVQLQRPGLGGHRFGVAGRGRQAVQIEALAERMAGEPLGDGADLRGVEPDEAEVVDRRQQAEELVFGHEPPTPAKRPSPLGAAPTHGRCGSARG